MRVAALDNPLASAGLALPVVGPNLRASRELARIGVDLARTGEQTSASVDPDRIQVVDGTVPLDEVRRVTPDLRRGARELTRAVRRLDRIDQRFLLSPMGGAARQGRPRAERRVARRRQRGGRSPAGTGDLRWRCWPALLPRRAERRRVACHGGHHRQLGHPQQQRRQSASRRFERIALLTPPPGQGRPLSAPKEYVDRYGGFEPTQIWQNINMSPDFPTVAGVISDQYGKATGDHVDGVLAVDPEGLAALLQLTGPVEAESWPEPITADNVVRIVLSDAYVRFPDPSRVDFLGDVAHAVVDRATSIQLGNPAKIARVLGRAARDGHITLAFGHPEEEALAQRLDIAGRVPPVSSDSLLVTTQNAAANKLDYYLRRQLDYTLRLDPVAGATRPRGCRVGSTCDSTTRAPIAACPNT